MFRLIGSNRFFPFSAQPIPSSIKSSFRRDRAYGIWRWNISVYSTEVNFGTVRRNIFTVYQGWGITGYACPCVLYHTYDTCAEERLFLDTKPTFFEVVLDSKPTIPTHYPTTRSHGKILQYRRRQYVPDLRQLWKMYKFPTQKSVILFIRKKQTHYCFYKIVCNDSSPISISFADFWKLLKSVYVHQERPQASEDGTFEVPSEG